MNPLEFDEKEAVSQERGGSAFLAKGGSIIFSVKVRDTLLRQSV